MDVYKTEEEQVEAIKEWWKENGKSIVTGVVVGIAAIFGWRAYDNHTVLQAEAASTLYEQMITAAREDDAENIRVYADRIIDDHKSTTYGAFATLMLAKLAAEAGKLDQAETHLRWVLNNSPIDGLDHVARLRLARILIAGDKLDSAAKLLDIKKQGDFVARYEELRGDILVKQGKLDEAQAAYQKSLLNAKTADDGQSVLQMKLDNLGRS